MDTKPTLKQPKVAESQHIGAVSFENSKSSSMIPLIKDPLVSTSQSSIVPSPITHDNCLSQSASVNSSSRKTPIVSTNNSSIVPSPVTHDSCLSQPASVSLSSSKTAIVSTSISSIVPSAAIHGNNCLSQSPIVTSISVPCTKDLNFPPDLQSLLPCEYSYVLGTYEDMPKGDFIGAPVEYFKAKFYIKLESEEAACK